MAAASDIAAVVPTSPAMSWTSAGWLTFSADTHESLGDRVVSAFRKVCKEFGGPRQYLAKRFSTMQLKQEFYENLIKFVPPADDEEYHRQTPMSPVMESDMGKNLPLKLHISMLSWDEKSSLKGPPEAKVAIALADQIMSDGFMTSGEPLLVNHMSGAAMPNFDIDDKLKPEVGIGIFDGTNTHCTIVNAGSACTLIYRASHGAHYHFQPPQAIGSCNVV
jgi:hypothetical protein